MIEAMGGAPPVMLGISVILWVLSLCVPAWGDAYIRVMTFRDSRPRDLRFVANDGDQNETIGMILDATQDPPEQSVPLPGRDVA